MRCAGERRLNSQPLSGTYGLRSETVLRTMNFLWAPCSCQSKTLFPPRPKKKRKKTRRRRERSVFCPLWRAEFANFSNHFLRFFLFQTTWTVLSILQQVYNCIKYPILHRFIHYSFAGRKLSLHLLVRKGWVRTCRAKSCTKPPGQTRNYVLQHQ